MSENSTNKGFFYYFSLMMKDPDLIHNTDFYICKNVLFDSFSRKNNKPLKTVRIKLPLLLYLKYRDPDLH
jgi:hypothetical protein